MWVLSRTGFYSIVAKGSNDLQIRSRVKADLIRLKNAYLPTMAEIEEHTGTDYEFRCAASFAEVSKALAQMSEEIDYSNFKDMIYNVFGHARESIYAKIWLVLTQLSQLSR